jgi:hypothetical protein
MTTSLTLQRLQALQQANEVRQVRATLKRQIAQGTLSAAAIMLKPPHEAGNWSIGDLLISQRGWGNRRCSRFLARNQLNELKPITALTDRQRTHIAAQLKRPPHSTHPGRTSGPSGSAREQAAV